MGKGRHWGFHVREGMERPRIWLDTDEDPLTESLDQARGWLAFYRDLAAVEGRLLEEMRRIAADLPDAQRRAVEVTNIEPMVEFVSDLQERRQFWLDRQKTLTRPDPA